MLASVLALAAMHGVLAAEDEELPPAEADPMDVPMVEDMELGGEAEAEAGAVAGDAEPVVMPAGFSAAVESVGASLAGRDAPASPAREAAYVFVWEDYHSVVVVQPGSGLIRPALVITYQGSGDNVAVAYRAMAFRDVRGVLHIDARNALLSGPQSRNWSPDSFLFLSPSVVSTLDDQNRAQSGVLTGVIPSGQDEYRSLLMTAEAIVEGSS
ncbi:MAG: hypothetical protein H0W83_00565 [Planctomycetes bacterium]|nr:hypothetical protein [Planctomycetota bacterium]